jgi:hypothetical protein
MSRNQLFIMLCMLYIVNPCFTQVVLSSVGARAAALGSCSVTLCDALGIFNNQAAAAHQGKISFALAFENPYLLKETGRVSIGGSAKAGRGALLAGIDHFGNQLYSEMKAGAGYALKLGKNVVAGLQLDYLRISIGEGYGGYHAVTLEGGIMAFAGDKVAMGIHCFNPVSAGWMGTLEKLPIMLRAGGSYSPEESIIICVEITKNTSVKAIISAGCEYRYQDRFFIRAGISSGTTSISFGAGYRRKSMNIDIAASWHAYLGFYPQLSFTFSKKQ